jgi:hypothetical protein
LEIKNLYERELGHKVSPRKKVDIQNKARKLKDLIYEMIDELSIQNKFVPIIKIYDHLRAIGFLEYEVVEDSELGERLAETLPDKKEIRIKESVFNGACNGDGFHRFTLAHELGHLVLHKNQQSKAYARGVTPNHKIFEDSEWQADEFASEFLIDSRDLNGNENYKMISNIYGLSHTAAKEKIRKANI